MRQDWILDVLADLRVFARKNDMPLLAAQLDQAMTLAVAELASKPDKPTTVIRDEGSGPRHAF